MTHIETADQIRAKLIGVFEKFKPSLDAYYDYAQQAAALAEAYHGARLRERFGLDITEEVLVATLDARETPKTLDNFLSDFRPDKAVRRIVFDRVHGKYYIYC